MRKLLCLVLLAACELQPAPKKQPPAAATPAPAPAPAKPSAPPAPALPGARTTADGAGAVAGAGPAAAKPDISEPCMAVATKVAQVFIDSAKDPAQKNVYEQSRAIMTRKTGQACTAQGWSEEARTCYLAAKSPADIKACELEFSPPPPPKRPAPREG